MTEHVIAVLGSSPGVGKSTLCRALAGWISGKGCAVDHFKEEDILTRPVFRPVAEEFNGGSGRVRPRTLVNSTRSYLEQARAEGVDVLVTDALLPFIPSLVAWGHDEAAIAQVVDEVGRAVEPSRVSVVYLRDDPEAALRRAVEREGPRWADWYVDRLRQSPGTRSVTDLAAAADHLCWESELTLRLLAATRWNVMVVDVGDRDAAETERDVRQRLEGILGFGVR
ncbi:hypothetical protein ACFYYR_26160 [Streptomyces sp. NPDC001922]|uniref:hypothetical protein n=1 Tax=Streptomyces sp. NPDC001922 TaxID=3364624 RepID=UPI0036B2626B